MTERLAKRLALGITVVLFFTSIHYVFIDKEIVGALCSIPGTFTFWFLYDNPELMLSSSWKEFGERVDVAKGRDRLTGNPTYYAAIFFSVLYILLT